MPAETFRIKVEAAGHIDELMLVAEYDGYKSDVGNKHENDFAEDGFNYWTAFFEDSDGGHYRIKISVGLSGGKQDSIQCQRHKRKKPLSSYGSSAKRRTYGGGCFFCLARNRSSGYFLRIQRNTEYTGCQEQYTQS